VTHELVRTLNRTFVTPFDREDIYALASGLDDVLDYIEEIGDTVTLYKIERIPAAAIEMVELICSAVLELQKGVGKLEGLKGVEEHGIEVHRLENLGDTASRRAIGELFAGGSDAVVARLSPILSTLGTVVHVGAIGAGSAAKLVANFSLINVLAALGEAFALGRHLGLSDQALFDVLAASPLAT